MHVLLFLQAKLRKDRVDVLFDRPLGQKELGGDRRVVLSLSHGGQHLLLAWRQVSQRRVGFAGAGSDQRLDHLRIDDRTSPRDLTDGVDQLIDVGNPLFQEVGAAGGALFQQAQRVFRLRVLTQDHHADLRVACPDLGRGPNAFVGTGRGHPDVCHDHGRALGLDGGHQGGEVGGGGGQLEFRLGVDQLLDAFP